MLRKITFGAMTRTLWAAAVSGLLALAGCDQIDPLSRTYMWQPSDANARNLAAMAANPDDLVHGREATRRQSVMDANSVEHLWSGKPLPLLTFGPAVSSPSGGTGSGGN